MSFRLALTIALFSCHATLSAQEFVMSREALTAKVKYQDNLLRVFRSLDVERKEHREAFRMLQSSFGQCEQSQVGPKEHGLEVVLFHEVDFAVPGTQTTVVALFRDYKLIDLLHRRTNTRAEVRDAVLEDANGDGIIDVVLRCGPSMISKLRTHTIAYKAGQSGLTRIKHPGRATHDATQ